MTDLRECALVAIDEAARMALKGPVKRTFALKFALTFLANFSEERWPFDNFWNAIQDVDDKGRSARVNAARNAIRHSVSK